MAGYGRKTNEIQRGVGGGRSRRRSNMAKELEKGIEDGREQMR